MTRHPSKLTTHLPQFPKRNTDSIPMPGVLMVLAHRAALPPAIACPRHTLLIYPVGPAPDDDERISYHGSGVTISAPAHGYPERDGPHPAAFRFHYEVILKSVVRHRIYPLGNVPAAQG